MHMHVCGHRFTHFCECIVDRNCYWQSTESIPIMLHLLGSQVSQTTWMKCTLHIYSLRHSISSCFLGQNSALEDQCKMTGKLLMLFTSKWDWGKAITALIQCNNFKWVVLWVIKAEYFDYINIQRLSQYCFFLFFIITHELRWPNFMRPHFF